MTANQALIIASRRGTESDGERTACIAADAAMLANSSIKWMYSVCFESYSRYSDGLRIPARATILSMVADAYPSSAKT